MGRGKNKQDIINIAELKLDSKIEIDYDMLAKAIIKAKDDIYEEERKQQAEKDLEIQKKRREILGEKDFSHIKSKVRRELMSSLNEFKVMWKMLTLTREEAAYFTTVKQLTKMLTSFLLSIIGLAIYVLAGVLFYISISKIIIFTEGIIFSAFLVIFARMIRIARFEIDRIEDSNYLMSVSMLIIALVTLIATIIGLFLPS